MMKWVVTGPVGSGKSAVSAILKSHGAAIVDGDLLGHEVLALPEIRDEIGRAFGSKYVGRDRVNRPRLGELVFSDADALLELNRITHPALARLASERLESLAAAGNHRLAVFEAAVYFLLPSPPSVDLVVAVVAPPAVRLQRLLKREAGRLTETAAQARIKAQEPMAELWSRADESIVNDGTRDELLQRTLRLMERLLPGSEKRP